MRVLSPCRVRGFTLFEMLSVIGVISLATVTLMSSVIEDQRYQSVADAVAQAQTLASAVEQGRRLGLIDNSNWKTLGEIVADCASDGCEAALPVLKKPASVTVLGENPNTLFEVWVSGAFTQVRFTITGDGYKTYQFPNAGSEYNAEKKTLTVSVAPRYVSGIHAVTSQALRINED